MTTLTPTARSTPESPATFDNGHRGRFNAWFFTTFDGYVNYIARRHKQHAFGGISPGTIVEIGAGVGANFDYVPGGSRMIAIEPNRAMHDGLLRRAAMREIALELLADDAQQLSLPNDSVDEVLCSLVLCTVTDPDAVLAEIRRVLRPGGRFRFVEHVAAPAWSPRRWLQHVLRRPWRWIYEGCDLCRDTASKVEHAGFAQVDLHLRRFGRSCFVPANTAIYGVATN